VYQTDHSFFLLAFLLLFLASAISFLLLFALSLLLRQQYNYPSNEGKDDIPCRPTDYINHNLLPDLASILHLHLSIYYHVPHVKDKYVLSVRAV
jgi:hypothetical protein